MVDQREAMRPVGGNDVLRLPDEQTGKDDYAARLKGPRHVLRERDERIGKDIRQDQIITAFTNTTAW